MRDNWISWSLYLSRTKSWQRMIHKLKLKLKFNKKGRGKDRYRYKKYNQISKPVILLLI